jgi:hypothetical protein
MEKYKEKIEKEAEKVMMNYLTGNNPDGDFIHSTIGADDNKNWWIAGYNACLNSKISERIKIDFAIECLEEIKQESPFNNYVPHQYFENKITELKNKIK